MNSTSNNHSSHIHESPSALLRANNVLKAASSNSGSHTHGSSARDQSRERERERLTERLRQDREALAQSASYLLGGGMIGQGNAYTSVNESNFNAYLSPIRPVKHTVQSTHSLYPLETVSGTGSSSLRVSRTTSSLNNLTQKKLSK